VEVERVGVARGETGKRRRAEGKESTGGSNQDEVIH